MSEEPDTIIDCYLAISIDSLVLISEETKVRTYVSVVMWFEYTLQ